MDPYQFQQYVNSYNSNPWLFDDDTVDELERVSKELDIPFKRNMDVEEEKQGGELSSLVNQFASGAVEGFSTLGWSDDPVTPSEQIAHSMGHLIGFVPGIIGAPLLKGTMLASSKLGLGLVKGSMSRKVLKKTENIGKFLAEQKSLPFQVAEFAQGKYVTPGLAKAGYDIAKATKEGSVVADIASSGINLGLASGASSIWGGPREIIESTIHGAAFGGAFGTIGNFTNMRKLLGHPNPKVAQSADDWWFNKVVKGGLGAGLQGGLAFAQDAPTSVVMYETLLGSYFGYKHPSAKRKQAMQYTDSFSNKENEVYGDVNVGRSTEMLKTSEYNALHPEAQEYVKRIFKYNISEKYDRKLKQLDLFIEEPDTPTEASVFLKMMKERLVSNVESEEAAMRMRKGEYGELSEMESLDAKARSMDKFDRDYEQFEESSLIYKVANEVIPETKEGEKIDKDKPLGELSKDVQEVVDNMSETQLERARGGDIEAIMEVVKGNVENNPNQREGIDYVTEKMDKDQLELDTPTSIRYFLREIEKSVQGEESPIEILDNILGVYKDSVTKKDTYETFIEKVKDKADNYVPSTEVENGLKQLFNRVRNEELRPYLFFNKGGWLGTRDVYNGKGDRVAENQPPPSDEVHFKKTGDFFDNVKVVEFKEFDAYGGLHRPYDKHFGPSGEMENVMYGYDWLELSKSLDKGNRYLKIPKKDNGVERVYPYHKSVKNLEGLQLDKTWDHYMKVFSKITSADPNSKGFSARDLINKDATEWLKFHQLDNASQKDKSNALAMYRKAMLSNFLYEPGAQFANAQKRVKYESLLASKGMPQKDIARFKDIVGDEGVLEFIPVIGEPDGKVHKSNVKGQKEDRYLQQEGAIIKDKMYESEIDGYLTLHSDLYKRLLEANGFGKDVSRLKPSIAAWIGDQLFIVKGGVHPSHPEYDVSMGASNRGIVMTSAAKILPNGTKSYYGEAVGYKNKTYQYHFKDSKTGKRVKNPETVKIKLEDLRIDYGVREDAHALESQTIKKQFHVLLNKLQIPEKAFKDFMSTAFDEGIQGNSIANAVVKSVGENPKMPIPKNFRISEIGDAEFTKIVSNPKKYHSLYKELLKEMVGETKYRDRADSFAEEDFLVELDTYVNELQRWAKYSDFDPVSAQAKPELYQAMILRYRKNKYMYPKWKHSASGWVAGVDPISKAKYGKIEKNTFKLGHSYKGKMIKVGGIEKSLSEVWDLYKNPKTSARDKKIYAEALTWAIMRVPSPAVAGTRILNFRGFIDNDLKLSDYGVYMHQKDHFYIDGADVDGDKVFMYQGLPKTFTKAVFEQRNELSYTKNGKQVMFPNKDKSKKVTEEFGSAFPDRKTEALFSSKISQYTPFALRKVGMSAYEGKESMGTVVNAKTFLNYVTADIIDPKTGKGIKALDIFTKGKKDGTMYLETSLKHLNNVVDGYRKYAVEASSRTADSSEYWNMIDARTMRDLLFSKAFYDRRFVDKDGKSHAVDFNDLKNTEYGELYNINEKLFGKNHYANKPWSIEEVQLAMRNAKSSEFKMNSLFYLANKMADNDIQLRYEKGSEGWRRLVRSFNEAVNGKDSTILPYINRKNLKITPSYMKTDYAEAEQRMDSFYLKHSKLYDENSKISVRQLRIRGMAQANKNVENLDANHYKLYQDMRNENVIRPHDPLTESKLVFNDMMDMYSAMVVSKKGEKLIESMNDAGRSDLAYSFLQDIAQKAVNVKSKYNRARKSNIRKKIGSIKTLAQSDKNIKAIKEDITKKANSFGIDSKIATDYFYNYMLSSLYNQPKSKQATGGIIEIELSKLMSKEKPTERDEQKIGYYQGILSNMGKWYNKTSFHRFPIESREVPESAKREFMGGFAKAWNLMRDNEPYAKIDKSVGERLVAENIDPIDAAKPSEKKIASKSEIERLYDPIFEGVTDKKLSKNVPEDIPSVLKELENDFSKLPPEATLYMEDFFGAYQNEKQVIANPISESNWDDIRGFQKFVRQIRIEGSDSSRMKKVYYYMFPERVGEKALTFDMSQTYKHEIPYLQKNGNIEMLDVRLPFSTMKYLSTTFGHIYTMSNIEKEINQEMIQRRYELADQIKGMDGGTTEFAKLHRLAVAKMLKEKGSESGSDDAKKAKRIMYDKVWEENSADYDALRKKTYKITEDGKLVNKTGDEVMDWIGKSHGEFLDSFYSKWISAGFDESGSRSIWDRVDVDHKYGKIDDLFEYLPSGRLNINRIRKKLYEVATHGKKDELSNLIQNTILSSDALYRIQYETMLEGRISEAKISKDSSKAKAYRERARRKFKELPDGELEWNLTAFKPTGYVGAKFERTSDSFEYWPHTDHMATRKSRREVKDYISNDLASLRVRLDNYTRDVESGNDVKIEDYGIKQKLVTVLKADKELYLEGKLSKEEFIERFVALQEQDYEVSFGARQSEDGGASEHAMRYLLANHAESDYLTKDMDGFNSRPGSGKARGDEPMPGFSLDFEVLENYSNQWIAGFHNNLTALVAHDRISDFSKRNPIKNKDNNEEWENYMKMYTRDVLGFPSVFNSDMIGLNKNQRRQIEKEVSAVEKAEKEGNIVSSERFQRYKEHKETLRKDKQRRKIRKTPYYWLSDEVVGRQLGKLAKALGGKDTPKLPSFEDSIIPKLKELPKTDKARQYALRKVAQNIGAFEAKWSLISLLSHPKTAMGNIMGGSINTISSNGVRHFVNAKRPAYLYSIFKGAKLKNGTEITPDNVIQFMNRFAEESGALESFIVSEAQLARGFSGKKVKGFLSEFVDELKKDYNMPDQSLYDIGKNHGIGKAFIDGGAWFMRKSERMLRRDSFISHYLSARETLSQIVPDIAYNDPYLIRHAVKGVEATQFLYHSSARPAFSRTSTGKIFTRFMPFAWNSIKFRRQAWSRAKVHGFDINTPAGKRLQRQMTADMMVFALGQIFVSSIFDSAMPPPMSYMQDTADWLFGDEKTRERAFFNQWPHPALAPLSAVTGPSMRYVLGPLKALINDDWGNFADYHLWTWAPFGRMARSAVRTYDVPEMWMEELTGMPIHRLAQMMKKSRKEKEEQELLDAA